jgi:hypothetical protein
MANLRPSLTGISLFSNSTSGVGIVVSGPRYGNCKPRLFSVPVGLTKKDCEELKEEFT